MNEYNVLPDILDEYKNKCDLAWRFFQYMLKRFQYRFVNVKIEVPLYNINESNVTVHSNACFDVKKFFLNYKPKTYTFQSVIFYKVQFGIEPPFTYPPNSLSSRVVSKVLFFTYNLHDINLRKFFHNSQGDSLTDDDIKTGFISLDDIINAPRLYVHNLIENLDLSLLKFNAVVKLKCVSLGAYMKIALTLQDNQEPYTFFNQSLLDTSNGANILKYPPSEYSYYYVLLSLSSKLDEYIGLVLVSKLNNFDRFFVKPLFFKCLNITIENITKKYFQRVHINNIVYDFCYLIKTTCLKNNNSIPLFKQYFFLKDNAKSFQPNKAATSFFTLERNQHFQFHFNLMRLLCVKTEVYSETPFTPRSAQDILKSLLNQEESKTNSVVESISSEEEQESVISSKTANESSERESRVTKDVAFNVPVLDQQQFLLPSIYVVYDIETLTDSNNKFYCFGICAEVFTKCLSPVSNDDTDNIIPSLLLQDKDFHTFSFSYFDEEIFDAQFKSVEELDNVFLPAMNERVIIKFLNWVMDIILKEHEQFLNDILFETNYRIFNSVYLRFVGFNSSNFDDKFLIPFFKKVFKYHERVFASRSRNITKHILTKCQAFGRFSEDIIVQFYDLLRYTPEINKLSVICKDLNVDLPKIEFNILKFISNFSKKTLKRFVNVKEFVDTYFDNTLLHTQMKKASIMKSALSNFKAEWMSIFKKPLVSLNEDVDVLSMASYYCERDVCATKEVLNILSINFNRVLTEIFTKSILNVSTDVEANKLMLFSGFKPFIRKVFTTNDEDIDNLLIFEKKEITQFSFFYYRWYDFFAYFSISQISYLMVKLIAVLKKYRRFNPRNIDLFHFIKSTYFGGRVDIGLVGAFTGKIKMIDVKSEYPLAMTGPLPLINEKYTYIFNLNEEWLNFLNNKIKSALEFREITMLEQNFHKRFKVFEFIDFIGVFMCIVKIPDKEEYASIFSPLPFPERLTKDTRSIRYFTFSQKRILTSVHIASLIYQGWNVEIIYDPNNILFNVLNNEQKNKYKQKFDNICNNENEINKRFVSMNSTSEFCWLAEYVDIFGKLKANAASNNDEVLKKIYKMLLNATAGRLGMKIVATYEDVEHSFNEFHDTFKVNKRSKKVTLNNSDFYIATFINAYGAFIITSWQYKLQLKSIYNKIPMYERVKTVLYTDTDSIAYNMNEILDEVESSIVYSKDIGNYSIEDKDFNVTFSIKAECNLFIGFAKKSYILADINNAGDWCLHSFMHKGIPANELRKHFLISNHNNAFVINKKLLHETFTSGQALLSYDHIKRITDPNDMSLKTFENITLTKRFNYLTLGLSANSNDQLFNYSFQPLIKLEPCVEDFICDATHSPCSYVKCIYCREFTFHMGSKIVNFNHNYIF